jgi:hypothetical protein
MGGKAGLCPSGSDEANGDPILRRNILMNVLIVLAQGANGVDPATVGLSIPGLVGSLGAAGAAVAVTYYFLGFLKDQSQKQNLLFDAFRQYHSESQKRFQDQLDRLTNRQEQSQRAFQNQVSRVSEAQNTLLRDAVLAMKAVEKTLDSSSETIRSIEKTITSLQVTVSALDMVVRRSAES